MKMKRAQISPTKEEKKKMCSDFHKVGKKQEKATELTRSLIATISYSSVETSSFLNSQYLQSLPLSKKGRTIFFFKKFGWHRCPENYVEMVLAST